jgi:hypothetical protein
MVGDVCRITARWVDASNAPVDPDALSFKIKNPTGAITTYAYGGGAVVRQSQGSYYLDVACDAAGTWQYRAASTGSGQAAAEGSWSVAPSAF